MDPSTPKVNCSALNARQKENLNYYTIAATLCGYGVDCARPENAWNEADFLAIYQG